MNPINKQRALKHLLNFLAIEGLSGREKKVSDEIVRRLKKAGCKDSWIHQDQVHKKIPGDFETGNLIVKIPGTTKAPRLMFSGHMDTVPLCRGAVPLQKGNRIVSKTKTALGGDNRTALACMIFLAEILLEEQPPHPPITLLFTVGEETGLWGARFVSKKKLGNPEMGINIDSSKPEELIVGAIGAHRWEANIHGISSHAGVHPHQGISAILIASQAIAEVKQQGYFGRIRKGVKRGASNVGVIQGGEATNQVADHVFVKGESRSHDPVFLDEITSAYKNAFQNAAKNIRNHKKKQGKIDFHADTDYHAFNLKPNDAVVIKARQAAKALGLCPQLKRVDGGLDANYLNAKGIPTITIGAGQQRIHSLEEYVDIQQFLSGCQLAIACATLL